MWLTTAIIQLVVTILGFLIGSLIVYLAFRKRLTPILDGIVQETMCIIQERIWDSDIVETMIQKFMHEFVSHVGGKNSGSARRKQTFDKRLVDAMLKQYANPIALKLAEQAGLVDLIQKDPTLLFYAMEKYPKLFPSMQEGQHEQQTSTQMPQM